MCPIDGLYGLRGAIGPPYIPSRHKRNHNQRSAGHTNNHSVFGHDTMAVASQQQQQHRRHIQSSFRSSSSSEQLARHSWKSPTRGVAVRNRRDTEVATLPKNDTRVRRDANGCVVNHNSRRQLLVGCTETNVIEVRPYCTEDNDEGGSKISCGLCCSSNNSLLLQCTLVMARGRTMARNLLWRSTWAASMGFA